MKSRKSTKYLIITLLILIILIIILSYELFLNISNINEKDVNIIDTPDLEEVIPVDEYAELKEIYKKNKEINDDYIGQIYFESGLINLPFVQGETNDTYLRTDWESGEYEIGGSIFLDAENDVKNDNNLILYGHNYPESYDSSMSKMFTPLHFLIKQENYEKNKIINLFLGDRLLKYEIASVFRVEIIEEDGIQYIGEDEPIYVIRNYSLYDYNDYINKIKEREYYDTGILIEHTDNLLTLQTCFDDSVDKLIVLAKQIEVIHID